MSSTNFEYARKQVYLLPDVSSYSPGSLVPRDDIGIPLSRLKRADLNHRRKKKENLEEHRSKMSKSELEEEQRKREVRKIKSILASLPC